MAAKNFESEFELVLAELIAEDLELSTAELEDLEANPRRPRKKKKSPKRTGKKQIPRDGLGRFALKTHAT